MLNFYKFYIYHLIRKRPETHVLTSIKNMLLSYIKYFVLCMFPELFTNIQNTYILLKRDLK